MRLFYALSFVLMVSATAPVFLGTLMEIPVTGALRRTVAPLKMILLLTTIRKLIPVRLWLMLASLWLMLMHVLKWTVLRLDMLHMTCEVVRALTFPLNARLPLLLYSATAPPL